MISVVRDKRSTYDSLASVYQELVGKSTDVKPILKKRCNGSTFYELDTQNLYLFDGDTLSWVLQ